MVHRNDNYHFQFGGGDLLIADSSNNNRSCYGRMNDSYYNKNYTNGQK